MITLLQKGVFRFTLTLTGFTLLILIAFGLFSSGAIGQAGPESPRAITRLPGDTYSYTAYLPYAITRSPGNTYSYTAYLPFVKKGEAKLYMPGIVNQYPEAESVFGVEMDGGYSKIAAIGNAWIHMEVMFWSTAEITEGVINWAPYASMDALFKNAANDHLRPILVIKSTPSWAQKYPPYACGPIDPTKYAAFGDFLYALVSRYSAPPYNVMYYELWNEPDVDPLQFGIPPNSGFGCWGNSSDYYYGGGEYADMLKVVYPRIKQANPNAQVLTGGLLLNCDPRIPLTNDPNNGAGCRIASRLPPPRYLEGIMLHNGDNDGGNYFDGVSFHGYEWGQMVQYASRETFDSKLARDGPSFLKIAAYVRSILAKYGHSEKFLINTEGALLCDYCTYTDTIHETSKALYAALVYPAAIANNIKAFTWFSVMGWPSQNTAVLNHDLSPRLVYTAMLASRSMLANAVYLRDIVPADIGGTQGVKGYTFLRGSGQLWTLWAYDGNAYSISLPAGVTGIWDYLGNPVSIPASRVMTIGLDSVPFVYVAVR